MKYREHRGGLSESMATMVEVDSLDELTKHLKKTWPELLEIEFSYVGFDGRIGWDTYNVCVKLKGQEENGFMAIGQSDGKFDLGKSINID